MPRKRTRRHGLVDLPKGVHRVVAKGKEYFYWNPDRGKKEGAAFKAVRLPDDPHGPEFWVRIRELQGDHAHESSTVNAAIDAYEASPAFTRDISEGTRDQYRRALRKARKAWGNLPVAGIRPVHVKGMMDALAETPGAANNFLSAMRAFSTWALARDWIAVPLTAGSDRVVTGGGHKPWTDEQVAAAHRCLAGDIRKGVMLMLYTGQRGSDMVRMGWPMIDEGGFSLKQQKTGVEVWCPIVPELAAEMATWEKAPGPFVKQPDGRAKGRPYTRKLFSIHFDKARESIPELAGVTLHGLRATAVIRLRRAGCSTLEIESIVGMSAPMIARYCRFDDKKKTGQAAVVRLAKAAAGNENGTRPVKLLQKPPSK
jgi:integrase